MNTLKPNKTFQIKKNWKYKIRLMFDHIIFNSLMTFITIFALFGDDIRQLTVNKTGDNVFYILYIIVMIIFILEIILSSLVKEGYLFSFFFWLDIIATLSIIFDIKSFTDLFISNNQISSATSTTTIARAARASRIGTKAGRVIRIIRLIRIIKLYKQAQEIKRKQTEQLKKEKLKSLNTQVNIRQIENTKQEKEKTLVVGQNIKEEVIEDDEEEEEEEVNIDSIKESKVSKTLSELITKKVIIIVLSLMVSIPFLSVDTYFTPYTSYTSGLENILYFSSFTPPYQTINFNLTWNTYINQTRNRNKLISLEIIIFKNLNETLFNRKHGKKNDFLRESDIDTYINNKIDNNVTISIISDFDIKSEKDNQAYLSIGRTIFVCIILAGSALLFSNDANTLVLTPIEKMWEKINNITKNPVNAAKIEEEKAFIWEGLIKTNKLAAQEQAELANYETGLLENTIVKIGALLALGFGEAGSEIIAQNMENNGDVNPMIPGKKLIAIFGFCDIRNFTDATEVLQEDVMVFVNEIANIVHSIVDKNLGAANKNIGDAFLLVWKFDKEDIIEEKDEIILKKNFHTSAITEYSIYSFIKIIAKVKKSKILDKYRYNQKLNERINNYSVKMGFGLHVGWAIEGAIGSEYKIDASYLSPNVNMASRLEAATKQFGVPLLISGSMIELISENFKKYVRHIDRVTVKGSIQPVDLYTVDLDVDPLKIEIKDELNLVGMQKKNQKYFLRIEKEDFKKKIKDNKINCINEIKKDHDFLIMRKPYTEEFYKEWNIGFKNYLEGNWESALKIFQNTINVIENKIDGPSNTLIEIIKNNNGIAPKNWKGIRELTDK